MAIRDSMANAGGFVWRYVRSLVRHEGRMAWFGWLYGRGGGQDDAP